jgi:hypothetical protein
MKFLLIVLAAFAATGCAVGNKHNYTADPPTLAVQGTRSVAVAAQDARPYVITKEKSPDFVGLSRGGFGNPFDVTTESGRPLADDFAATITRSLQNRGFKSTAVGVAPSTAAPDVRSLAAQAGTERVALVSIHEWKSDTFQNTALLYEVVLRVFDLNGNELANNRISGRDNLGGSAWNPPDHAKGAVPAAYRKKLEELFGSEAVVRSLR